VSGDEMTTEKNRHWFVTPCGLDCHSCPIRLRTKEELNYWAEKSVDLEKIRCDGCRSDRRGHHWSPDCRILECCVYTRKLEFCAECPEFPCSVLKDWGKEYDHHSEAVKCLRRMRTIGVARWLAQQGMDE
jgi:hypothetical protein